jgi:hypothetical protein
VDAVLGGLGSKKDSPDYLKTATWHEKAAMQIEQLSHVSVDPLAIDAASAVAKRIRAIALTLRGVPVDLKALDSQAYSYTQPNGGVSLGWWGGRIRPSIYAGPGYTQTNYPQIQAERAKAIADSEKKRIDLSSQITELMIDAKKKLSEKFGIPF